MCSASRPPLAWVVPGPLRQLTGGYLYDAHTVDGLRARGWRVGVVDLGSTGWPIDLPAARRLQRALRPERWGAIVVDELAHPAVVAAVASGGLRTALGGAPLVLLVHHLRCSEPGPRPIQAIAGAVERLTLRAADLVICTSATTASTVRRLISPHTQVAVVRPGWDTHSRMPAPSPQPSPRGRGSLVSALSGLRERADGGAVGMPKEGPHGRVRRAGLKVLMVGHWTPRKRILDALHALERLPSSITLDLVGDTDRDPTYAARVSAALAAPILAGRVHVHGRVSGERLAALYRRADALLLCSSHEGYGMVLAEAVAAGLPIVATRVGAVPEVVRDGLEAELVEVGDVAALARALDRLAQGPDERSRRARLAAQRAATLPTWSASICAFDELLVNVIRRSTVR